MNVRDAMSDDAEAIRQVHCTSIEGFGPEAYDDEQVESWASGCESADYSTPIESDDVEFVVAEVDEELVGFGSLSCDPADG